ncbi:MAG: oligopeptide transporter, OPT family [Proteobacteria bacterium]|nr:oligopeptide transporter, OPT family [Pseudomonadota bacterium]
MSNELKPYVPAEAGMAEFTIKALILGVLMAVILGAANAYLGLKAGMTVSASFPAAVIAIAAFRLPFFRGTVLEQNTARTAAAVGEALVAGAIFTLPAFVMVSLDGERLWTSFNYWESSLICLVGGLMGILFVILLRRTLLVDADLPFPEGYACYEIVKSGQSGASGAGYVFGALGLGVLAEMLKNPGGIAIFKETREFFIHFPRSVIHHFNRGQEPLADIGHTGGVAFQSPLASPALMSVGYIIGPKYSCINFAGGVLAWLVLIPLALFINPSFMEQLSAGGSIVSHEDMAYTAWFNLVRPIAVGGMLVGSIYTLYGLRGSLFSAVKGIFSRHAHHEVKKSRTERDLNLKVVLLAGLGLAIPMAFIYHYFTDNMVGTIVSVVVMMITGFLFAAVGGWLVGIVGNSNQPVSGLTLSTLIIAALVMVMFGLKGLPGIAAVLAIAAVVCCIACLSGDMIQDLKVGQLIGGTPWKMELAAIIGTVVVAFTLVVPIIVLHEGNIAAGGLGIGGTTLPAPQAGLMAQLAKGIITGEMPWGLLIIGMFFALSLILIKAPAPMLIAVGMYLPFQATFAIFVGGVIKWIADLLAKRRGTYVEGLEGPGVLMASGFIAGEAITGVLLAALVLVGIPSLSGRFFGMEELPILSSHGGWLSLLVFAAVAFSLIWLPSRKKA